MASAASADSTLLHCNLADGDLQSVRVVANYLGQMQLQQLTASGHTVARPLTNNEWQAKKFFLNVRFGTGTLSKTPQGWWYELKTSGLTVQGYADCN